MGIGVKMISMAGKAGSIVMALAIVTSMVAAQEMDDDNPFRAHVQMDRFRFTGDEKVKLSMAVTNTKMKSATFKAYDMDYTTFQPVVYTTEGREADILIPYRLKQRDTREAVSGLVPRIIQLGPGETMTRVVDLRKIYKLEAGREYRVRMFFFPDATADDAVRSENTLSFKVAGLEQFRLADGTTGVMRSGVREKRHGVSPREVVMLFLNAEKERNWDNYFRYVKLESYVESFLNFARNYNLADDVEKLKVLDDFATFLKTERPDRLIDYSVRDESVIGGRDVAYVNALVSRYNPRYTLRFQYKYTLEKFRDSWLITDVEATVKKGR